MKIGSFAFGLALITYGVYSALDLYKRKPEERSEYFVSLIIGTLVALLFGTYFLVDSFN